ncbi:MAG: 1-(5-phosphoribosyl)-5-[(5-phosphoribosylamino)methylideneamino]imidazole-4-carboxamide isomerase [Eubacteriales bacterium]|nr:1-(5-phosphoribosyl)-5-[(5-phosphoribosylamino)methylideneamino]imidazole-4-carboxamide isomerase [Eubacteriales bacterium]
MLLFPAIDLYEQKVVRLVKGDYRQMTVYSDDPVKTAREIYEKGGRWLHAVDLEGAKDGTTPNFDVVRGICTETGLNVEIGGGIRSSETIERYLSAGVNRVILGTAAVNNEEWLSEVLRDFGERIAVGVDAKDGRVAVKGWLEVLDVDMFDFIGRLEKMGLKTAIVTDISKDGAMKGTNLELYRRLSSFTKVNITASGGISTYDDLRALKEMDIYGAILGKAMYTGAIELTKALEIAG